MSGNDQQTWISRKFVPSLSVSSVQSVMPSNLKRIYMKDLEVGNQPPDTYILGAVQDIFTIASKTDRVSRKLVLREVSDDGCSDLQIEVFTYGCYARQLEGSESSQLWAAMSGAYLRKYTGFNKAGWCTLSVRIGAYSNIHSSLTLFGLSSVRPSSAIGESFSLEENTLDIPRPHTAIGTLPSSSRPHTSMETPSSKGLSKQQPAIKTLPSSTGVSRPHTSAGTVTYSMEPPTSQVSRSGRSKGSAQKSLEFVTLSKVKENVKQNVYAVVNEVMKDSAITKRKVYHTILILVDQSCDTEDIRRKDLLLHIFPNDMSEPLPYSISRGDILRIRDMKCEMYFLENKYHGKIYSSKQLSVFTSGLQDPVVPRTTKEDLVLSDQDHEYIQTLRKWWASVSNQLDKEKRRQFAAHPTGQSNTPYLTVSGIAEEMVFNLYCQVLEVRNYSDAASSICVLRVTDGTRATYWTTVWSLENATHDLNTETDLIAEDEASIYITVIKDADTAVELKEGVFVELQQVRVDDISSDCPDIQDKRILQFILDRPTSRIIVLPSHHTEARRILSRLKDQDNESELDSCGTIQDRLNELQSTPPRLARPQERKVDKQLENVPRAAEEAPQELADQQDSYSCHANNNHLITENSEITFPGDIPASTQKDSSARLDKVNDWLRNVDEEAEELMSTGRQLDNPVNDRSPDQPYQVIQEACILHPLTPSPNSSESSVKEQTARKRATSNEDTCEDTSQKRITKETNTSALNSLPAKPSLESPKQEPVSVKDLLENAEDKKLYRLKGRLAQVLLKTKSQCLENNKCCVHDIVLGLCQACMKYYYRSDLLNDYQLPELINSSSPTDYLPCIHCSTCSVTESEKPRTVVPLFGLHLVIEENSTTSVMLNLNGDGAHFFFGQEATFSMAVEQPDKCLASKYAGLLSFLRKEIEVGVMPIIYYGTKCFFVYDTKINI